MSTILVALVVTSFEFVVVALRAVLVAVPIAACSRTVPRFLVAAGHTRRATNVKGSVSQETEGGSG